MSALSDLLKITDVFDREDPIFHVEAPDGRKLIAELPRQRTFLNLLIYCAPEIYAFATPNAGKRNPRLARLEGIKAGVFDVRCMWNHGQADVEFKGYSQGRPGELSEEQIGWGNRVTRLGHPVGCFFSEIGALRWLHERGAPVNVAGLEGYAR